MSKQGNRASDPRRGALALLAAVLDDGRLMAEALATPPADLAALDGPGQARAQRLATTCLRHVARADAMLKPHLRKPPPAAVLHVLRLATVEMLEAGEAAHGVVHSAVALTRSLRRHGHLSGLVNAVLRRVAETPPEAWAKLPPQRLPNWLRKRLVAAWGRPAVEAMEAAHMAGAPLDLTPRGDAPAWAERLAADLMPTGSLRLSGGQVSALPGYDSGAWWVQDAAAALPARLLAPKPGERVLDICAAPGGKTMQLAAAGAQVTALDISAPRMARLAENLARTGLAAECVVADALHWQPDRLFDAILLDAPCSATGTIRRHPDLPFVKQEAAIDALVALQARLLDRALGFLRPGGRLVYCTCSLLPEEGEGQLAAALARHPGLEVLPPDLPGIAPEWRAPDGGLRLRPDHWPERGGMDGFFMVCLQQHRGQPG